MFKSFWVPSASPRHWTPANLAPWSEPDMLKTSNDFPKQVVFIFHPRRSWISTWMKSKNCKTQGWRAWMSVKYLEKATGKSSKINVWNLQIGALLRYAILHWHIGFIFLHHCYNILLYSLTIVGWECSGRVESRRLSSSFRLSLSCICFNLKENAENEVTRLTYTDVTETGNDKQMQEMTTI